MSVWWSRALGKVHIPDMGRIWLGQDVLGLGQMKMPRNFGLAELLLALGFGFRNLRMVVRIQRLSSLLRPSHPSSLI